jgi:hypothetical protein
LKKDEKPMKNFEIDAENHVRVLDSGEVSATGLTFASEGELRRITAEWPLARLVEVWNRLPGAKPVRKFTDRQTACVRIWKAVQALAPAVAPQGVEGAPKAAASARKATRRQKAATARPGAKKAGGGRQGSKKAQILALLERSEGASLKELVDATGWQAHSVRGFLSGQVGKKMRLEVRSFKRENGERAYAVASR